MSRITTQTPETAEGPVKEAYEAFQKHIGTIPRPMELLSASPGLFELQHKRIQYYSKHPTLSFPLLAHIRYLSAHNLNYSFCMDFNKMMLKKQGLTDKDIKKAESDPANALLEENETALLCFVIKSIKDPSSVTDDEFTELRNLGWTDRDMVDALSQGVSMIDHSIMMQVFQMDQDCITG